MRLIPHVCPDPDRPRARSIFCYLPSGAHCTLTRPEPVPQPRLNGKRPLFSTRTLRFAGLASAAVLFASPGSAPVRAEAIYGITDGFNGVPQSLVRFDSASPGSVTTVGPLTGMVGDQVAAAIDFRPATGQLYLGAGGSRAQLFTVDLATAALTPVGPAFDPTGYGYPSFDFDPVRDELRVITMTSGAEKSNTNSRFDPDTGALIANDANVAYADGDENARDEPARVIGAAYPTTCRAPRSRRCTSMT
jgi:hypothetical protein